MSFLYRLFSYLVYLGAWLWGRGRASRDLLWSGRLGIGKLPKADIWLHAASVGEVRIIGHLMAYLRQTAPELRFHLTVMTRTGYQAAQKLPNERLSLSYFPIDVPCLWKRLLSQVQPQVVVIAETEIWPNFIEALANKKIPIVLVNGRLSERGAIRYRLVRRPMARLLATYDHLFIKAEEDLARYLALGVPLTKMTQVGDMKFDAPLVARTPEQKKKARAFLSIRDDQYLLVAGSTRPGEEAQLVALYRNLVSRFPQLRLTLVPRHIERCRELQTLFAQQGVAVAVAGRDAVTDDVAVRLVDRMGILIDLFAAADIAFVGGTLVDLGGHNLLEPVWAGTPVLFGPSLGNVRDAADYIVTHQHGAMVSDCGEMETLVAELLEGKCTFARKTGADLSRSATAAAGNHILKRVRHA